MSAKFVKIPYTVKKHNQNEVTSIKMHKSHSIVILITTS